MGRRISSWLDMTAAEMADLVGGGRWNFRHCNGQFCAAEQVVNGTCGGECHNHPGQQTIKTVTPTNRRQKGKQTADNGNSAKGSAAQGPKATATPAASATDRADRRQAAARQRAARTRADWDGYEDSAYQSAESATRGHMQRRGALSSVLGIYWPRGRRPWGSASKDLTQYWDGGGMVPLTLTEYKSRRRTTQGRPWSDPDDRPRPGKGRHHG